MKKYSNFRMMIEYIVILFCSYLLLSLIICIIGNYGYREVLTSWYQIYLFLFLYWWIPLFRLYDMEN